MSLCKFMGGKLMNELRSLDNKIKVKPYSPNLGGVVTGVDLSKEIHTIT